MHVYILLIMIDSKLGVLGVVYEWIAQIGNEPGQQLPWSLPISPGRNIKICHFYRNGSFSYSFHQVIQHQVITDYLQWDMCLFVCLFVY